MAEVEFRLPSGGPITLPCDSAIMDYIISLIKRGVAAADLHNALLLSITSCCSSASSLLQEWNNQQLLRYLSYQIRIFIQDTLLALDLYAYLIFLSVSEDYGNP
ncbi:hypothetical protein HAX54_033504 [Datura stramonium]|uniref:Uncharacterized protein n=1 Tax=Datura stramonium TaxID=4076 RepID=A0ABS8RQ24_DATST|nr:hypothetical protein [Datura stramonium]